MNGGRLAGGLLLVMALPPVRLGLESRMSLHMGVELPLLLLVGWLSARNIGRRWEHAARLDAEGLLSGTIASCVLAFWMLPAALDLAVIHPVTAWVKYAQWLVTGYLLRQTWRRASAGVAGFLLLNAAWMLATAGFLYIDAEEQLCVNYLTDDQKIAGGALIAWALFLFAIAGARLRDQLGAAE